MRKPELSLIPTGISKLEAYLELIIRLFKARAYLLRA